MKSLDGISGLPYYIKFVGIAIFPFSVLGKALSFYFRSHSLTSMRLEVGVCSFVSFTHSRHCIPPNFKNKKAVFVQL